MHFVRFFIQDLGEDHTGCVICLFFGLFLIRFLKIVFIIFYVSVLTELQGQLGTGGCCDGHCV